MGHLQLKDGTSFPLNLSVGKINDTYQACMIKESSFETVRQRGRKLIRKTVKIELANRDSING